MSAPTVGVLARGAHVNRAERGRSVPLWLAVGVLAFVGGVVPIAIAWHFDALGIPRNDDWSYVLSAFRFADTGELDGNGWAATGLIGQLVLSLPVVWLFGERIAALQLEVVAFGGAGLVAVFDLAKRVLSGPRALFVAVMVAVGPMWASLSVSYMTDVPAFALAMICLALGARALRADELHVIGFWASLLAGFVAFTVREYAIVAPLAVLLTALWTRDRYPRRQRVVPIAALVSLAAMCASFLLWRQGLPGFTRLSVHNPSVASAKFALLRAAKSVVLLGLLLSPAVLLAQPWRVVRAAWARAPRASACSAIVTLVAFGSAVGWERRSASSWQQAVVSFLGPGNYVVQNGTLGAATVTGQRPDLLPKFALGLVTLVGVLAVVLVVLAAVPPVLDAMSHIRKKQFVPPASPVLAMIAFAALGYAVTCALPTLVGLAFLDRYLLPLVPLVAILVLRAGGAALPSHDGIRILSGAALAALAAFGLIYAANSASFDGTKWRIAEQAAREAGNAARVEGGFEWTNYHAGSEVFFANRDRRSADFCISLRAEEEPSGVGRELFSQRVWGPTGTQAWIVARQERPC